MTVPFFERTNGIDGTARAHASPQIWHQVRDVIEPTLATSSLGFRGASTVRRYEAISLGNSQAIELTIRTLENTLGIEAQIE